MGIVLVVVVALTEHFGWGIKPIAASLPDLSAMAGRLRDYWEWSFPCGASWLD